MKTYQMLWDCSYCDAQKLLALTHRHCPRCGAPQDPGVRYFPTDADKVEVVNHVFVGADVVCPGCQAPNSKHNACCANCGSPLTEAAAVRRRNERVLSNGASAPVDSKAAAVLEARAVRPGGAEPRKSAARQEPSWRKDLRTLALVFGIPVGLFILVVIANVVFSEAVKVQAVRHHWVREIAVERFSDVEEGAWCDKTPSGARVIDRSMETRSHKKVADGQSCTTHQSDNGDGTFTESEQCTTTYRSEPVESLYCTYLVTKWHVERTAKAEGDDPNPAWPATRLQRTGQCVGCEREGDRVERYELVLRTMGSGEEHTCEFDEAKWRTFTPGGTFDGELMMFGGLSCEYLVAR